MISLRIIESIISFITLSIAYVIGATTAGCFQAWVAKKMGDSTAEHAGFLTWNPFVHVDPVGAFCLLFFGVGWGRYVPINPSNIHGTWRKAAVYFANVFIYLALAIVALIILLLSYGINILEIALAILLSGYISLPLLAQAYPDSSSFALVIALILVVMVYLSVLLAVLNFFIDGFRFVSIVFFDGLRRQEPDLLMMVLPLVGMILFADVLRINVIYAVSHVAYFIAKLVGAV
jgi:hypothetical protein